MHNIPLDKQDVRILELLQEDCQIPRLVLAERVNLSASQCFRRIKRLEDSGLIERYTAIVNPEKAGLEVAAVMMIQFSKSIPNAREQLIALLQQLDVVHHVYSVTGEHDFLVHVYCESMKAFSQVVNQDLQVSCVSGIHSYMLLECFKRASGLNLATLTQNKRI